ncbi:MaoC/PaaZ C-terminal domain-containing protein [Janibacter melonis]|uniref:MaoC/PaaZ C-terminal domain-containing protein n=1 Tax=Janibacter melonis TaxID=262209 RepID=UPI00174D021F|nr:MaoC/PaaZ C-terminal domain-containing protein [Janibacter melonis]
MATETLTRTPRLGPVFLRSAIGDRAKGETLPDVSLRLAEQRVDRGDLRTYQRLCGFAADDTLPHTYPHVLGFPLQMELMSRRGFPLPLVGLVHVENAITVHRRLTADDVLDITVHAERLAPHPKGRTVDLVTVTEVAGEVVWEGRSTYLARGRGDAEAPRGDAPPATPTGHPAAVWSLPGDLGRQYARVSGDVNPIHMSALTARAMGFPSAIAHGMWTYARCLGTLGPRANGPSTSHVWFKKPVLLPGRVELVAGPTAPGATAVLALRRARHPETEHLVLTLD